MAMSFCSSVRVFVRLSVAKEICYVIRQVAAPGGEQGLFARRQHMSAYSYRLRYLFKTTFTVFEMFGEQPTLNLNLAKLTVLLCTYIVDS